MTHNLSNLFISVFTNIKQCLSAIISYGLGSLSVCVLLHFISPRAIRRTLMILMMVGFMGRAALSFSSSRVMPMMDSATMAISSWFHLNTKSHYVFVMYRHYQRQGCMLHPNISPVFEEPLYAKSHKLEQGLNDKDEREDVVTVLQNLL